MCEERERLLGYLYDESDASERRSVETHLDQCPECRTEIQALRQVRADLLAWEVPGAPDVWRPFPAAAPLPWWKQVPAWALAAAAGLVLTAGVAGGATGRALAAASPVSAPMLAAAPDVPADQSVTPADLAAAEQRIVDLVRYELDRRARSDLRQNVSYTGGFVGDQALQQVNDLNRESAITLEAMSKLYDEYLWYRVKTDERLRQLQEQMATMDLAMRNGLLLGAGGAGVPR